MLESAVSNAIRDGTSLNPFADLVDLATASSDPKAIHSAIYATYRATVTIAQSGKLDGRRGVSEETELIRKWLEARVNDFTDLLAGLMKDEEKALRIAALEIMMSLLTHLSNAISTPGVPRIHLPHFRKVVKALILCPPSVRAGHSATHALNATGRLEADIRDKFVDVHLSVHDDIRWFFLREATNIVNAQGSDPQVADNLLSYLERLMTMPTEVAEINAFWIPQFAKPHTNGKVSDDIPQPAEEDDDDWRRFFDEPDEGIPSVPSDKQKKKRINSLSLIASLHSLDSHRVQFSNCWASLVPHLASSSAFSTRALSILHRGVLPHFTRPVRLMDWISSCVDFGGSVGLLALNGLFTMIKDYNLDYPDFYTRLYAFVDRNILHVKYRARFFRLMDLFLSSTHLPVQLVASFVKRLSRLSLSAPPAALIMLMPFVYNLIKRHPALMVMIHQEHVENYVDPFEADEASPLLTNAIASSLWELASFQHHYSETIATLAKLFSNPFTKPPFLMEDFLDHTYTTLFETEAKRTFKKDPAMTFELKKDELFPEGLSKDVNSLAQPNDVVSELWVFG
ncbi:hypothetical protein FRC04_010663 [Tulasnella sp. 424]|nr:hypothetical protein FRC04_010663 [Tulasnella sp. 424]